MIEIKKIVKKFGDKKVVDDVSILIQENKITSLVGPNGAGKSTVLSIISRLMDSEQGEVLIDGRPVGEWENNELSKKIAILRQSNHVDIRLTIRELVSFGRFPYSQGNLTSKDEQQIDGALKYMKLESIQHKFLDQLSGGQRQRAYIAMVIAQNTKYILLDEPLNNLDMKHAVEIMKILRGLVNSLDKTVLLVIHDINFASCYSDHIVALNEGKVYKEGPPEKIIDTEVLKGIYGLDFQIENINDQRICVYF